MNRRNFLGGMLAGFAGLGAGALGLLSGKKKSQPRQTTKILDDGRAHHVITDADMNRLTLGIERGVIHWRNATIYLNHHHHLPSSVKKFKLWDKVTIKVQGHKVFVGYIQKRKCRIGTQAPIMTLFCIDAATLLAKRRYPAVQFHDPLGPREGQSWEHYWNEESKKENTHG